MLQPRKEKEHPQLPYGHEAFKIDPKEQWKEDRSIILVHILIFLFLVLASCTSSPLDQKFSENTLKEDLSEIEKIVAPKSFEFFTGFLELREFAESEDLDTLTYRHLFDRSEKIRVELEELELQQQIAAAEAKRLADEKKVRLGSELLVSVYDKGFAEVGYEKYLVFYMNIQNKSEREIRAFKGKIGVYDLFDAVIKEFEITYDKGVEAGETKTWDPVLSYNKWVDSDVTLKNKDFDNLKITWSPYKIIYEDGTTLE